LKSVPIVTGAALRGALIGGALLAATFACVEPEPYWDDGYYAEPAGVAELTIDAGRQVALDPGAGVGIGVEYAGVGEWRLTATCDTSLSDEICFFQVLVSSDESDDGIIAFEGVELEANDIVLAPDRFAVHLDFVTATEQDGIEFSTSPGATVRVSALLYDEVVGSPFDWSDDPRMISWVGSGAAHHGAPTNPVDLTPDRP
jgi:hypothetical protein